MNDTPGKRAWMCLLCGWVYYETLPHDEHDNGPGRVTRPGPARPPVRTLPACPGCFRGSRQCRRHGAIRDAALSDAP